MEIYLLGQFQVCHDGEIITRLNHARLQELLAYLLLQRGKPVSRQQLAFLFWPDSSEEQARTNLRNLVHRLRKALPIQPEFLNVDETRLYWRIDIPCFIDVSEFETAISKANLASKAEQIEFLEKALQFYGGDLLPECYLDWLLGERERLRLLYLASVKNLAELYENRREYAKAISKIQELLRLERLDENAYAWLMRLQILDGNRGEALHTYHTCAEILRRELGVDPGRTLHAMYEQLLRLPAVAASALPATALVARQAEWESLTSAWREMVDGSQSLQVLLITGEAGIGKTHLVRAFIDWVQRQGYPTATTICYETGQELAYAPLAAWLTSLYAEDERCFDRLATHWKAEITRLLPDLRTRFQDLDQPQAITEKWQLLHFYEGLRQAISHYSTPLLLFIDDIQWCDTETLHWLAYATSKLENQKTIIVATGRSEILASHHLARMLVDIKDPHQFIDLMPLSRDDTCRLVGQLVKEQVDGELVDRIYALSEGNPLFITELVRAGLDCYTDESSPLPARIQSVIAWRIERLSSSAQQIIELAAVIGRNFSYALLSAASSLDERSLVDGIDECWRQKIFREQGGLNYDFNHDLIRQVVYENLSVTRKRLYHKLVATTLEQVYLDDLDTVAEPIAYHLELSIQNDRAVLYYEQAALAAQKLFALPKTIALLEKAIKLLGKQSTPSQISARLNEQLGFVLLISGNYSAARQVFGAAIGFLSKADSLGQARMLRRIAQCWSSQQLYDETSKALEESLAVLGDQPTSGQVVEWWYEWLETCLVKTDYLYFKNQPDEMQAVIDQLEIPLEQYGSLAQQAEFFTLRGMLTNRRQHFRLTGEAVQFARSALSLAEQIGDPVLIARKRFSLGFNLLWYGDRTGAIEQLRWALEESEKLGASFVQDQALAYLTIAYRLSGDREKVSIFARRGLTLAEAENHPTYQGTALANLAWYAYHQDELEEAERLAEKARQLWGTTKYPFIWLANFLLASIAIKKGEPRLAQALLADTLGPHQQVLPEALGARLREATTLTGDSEATTLDAVHQALETASHLGYL